ncbi:protein of unknown function [Maridesulfovibrio hydrothermalis AM13 = DSM 14728]|uniref:Uncharacterized protein n=1 Tax=Maridesulfovibrio hydrothermalis AM13 = DSM 14728 TaxID=1121451 RepID=L0REV1_9BACT|nr:protein of unknown function [Maridesulfovibrio hydrothermalis AM13 = DSM 14728]
MKFKDFKGSAVLAGPFFYVLKIYPATGLLPGVIGYNENKRC